MMMKLRYRVVFVLFVVLGGVVLAACDGLGDVPGTADEAPAEATAVSGDEMAEVEAEPTAVPQATEVVAEGEDEAAEAEVDPTAVPQATEAAEETVVELVTELAPVSLVSVVEDHGIGGWEALVSGELPDTCTFISDTEQMVEENTISIAVASSRPQDLMCAQAVTPYEIEVLLNTSELADGEYLVEANGVTAVETVVIGPESAEGEEELDRIAPDAIQLDLGSLAESYQWVIREGYPPSPGPGGIGMPPNILLTFDGEDADQVLFDQGRYLFIFPVEAYENLVGDSVIYQVDRLQELIAEAEERQENPGDPMPLLPPPMSFMGRWVQFLDLNTQVGPGVRYVSEAPNRQSLGAWTNTGTAYYYEGLTEDGRLYISLHWPVRTDSLPETPQDVSQETLDQSSNPETSEQYWEEIRAELNALAPADWEPDLLLLDEMIASLAFEAEEPEAESEEDTEAVVEEETEEASDEETEAEPPISGQDTLLKLESFGAVGAEEAVLEGTQILVSVNDLQMSGLAGCNSFLADVEPQEGYFTIGAMTVTQKECTEPAGIMEQETAFLAALQGTNGFEYEQGGSSAVVAAILTYALLDGTNGVMNFVAP